ncbi:MAG: YlcI/YnfO family protein [Acidobacteriota bacterium]
MSTLSLRLPESLHRSVGELARQEGISMNQFIATAVAEKLAALTTVAYLEGRASRGDRALFERVLAKVPSSEPRPEDRLPGGE